MKGEDIMISPWTARLLKLLPKSTLSSLSRKIMDKYIDRYAKIDTENLDILKSIKKPCIFICNHLSNADGLILNKVLQELDLTFVAGVKLSNNPVTNLGINVVKTIPIKPNSADKEAMTNIVKTIKGGNNILIFPEGTRSREKKMIKAKKGILLIAKLTKAPIVPLALWGTEKLLPIEEDMGKETFHHATVKLRMGEPFMLPQRRENEGKAEYEERAIYETMGKIAVLLPEEYRGVYK